MFLLYLFPLFLFLATFLSGCMVGPDFHSPKSPPVTQYTAALLGKKTVSTSGAGSAGKAQYFAAGQDVPAAWWRVFHSCELDQMIRQGLANSPTLAAAQATLRQADDTFRAQVGALMWPNVTAQFSDTEAQINASQFGGAPGSSQFSLYNAAANVTYTLDVFGGNRRQLESLRAQIDYQRYQLEAAYLTLAANIVTTAITIASDKAQIEAMRAWIQEQEKTVAITKKQLQYGGASQSNVLAQQNQLAQVLAQLPPLEKNLAQSRHALAVLVGEYPAQNQLPELNLDKLTLPSDLPISVPSALTQQRPDVRSSEALLHAASAQVGVATANKYPQITLTGSYGWQPTNLSQMFQSSSNTWSFIGQITQPVFNAGALEGQRQAAIAAYQAANAQYRQTVLQAFQNVADSLRFIEMDAQTFKAQRGSEVALKETYQITRKQLGLGGVSELSVLAAQMQYQQARIQRIQAQAARYTDTAALFQALGGGWWNRKICFPTISIEGDNIA